MGMTKKYLFGHPHKELSTFYWICLLYGYNQCKYMNLTLSESLTIILVRIPAGEFWMGSATHDPLALEREKPQHRVSLPEYWIGQTPVTNAQYAAFVRDQDYPPPRYWNGSVFPVDKEDHPVINLSWYDADAFCAWASQSNRTSGWHMRLPSEAEWEKAARGVDGRLYPWGNQPPDAGRSNFDQHAVGLIGLHTTPVGLYSPQGDSPYGCMDMVGNSWEWCTDWFSETEYARRTPGPVYNPRGPVSGKYRVLRGGAWFNVSAMLRCACRSWSAPGGSNVDIGFRVVCSR